MRQSKMRGKSLASSISNPVQQNKINHRCKGPRVSADVPWRYLHIGHDLSSEPPMPSKTASQVGPIDEWLLHGCTSDWSQVADGYKVRLPARLAERCPCEQAIREPAGAQGSSVHFTSNAALRASTSEGCRHTWRLGASCRFPTEGPLAGAYGAVRPPCCGRVMTENRTRSRPQNRAPRRRGQWQQRPRREDRAQ